jgi:tellurite resistance protein TerC
MAFWFWLGLFGLLLVLIALDLRVARRRARDMSPAAAAGWTAAWIAVSLAIGGVIYLLYDTHWGGLGLTHPHGYGPPRPMSGHDALLLFLTTYVLEAALSLDNVFVMTLLFDYVRLPRIRRHSLLFTGALVAMPVRAVLIGAMLGVLALAPWASYVFGVFILVAAARMLTLRTDDPDPESNPAIRLVRKIYPVTKSYEGGRFFTRLPPDPAKPGSRGRLAATPLLLALIMVESADGFYSLGSIPSLLAISRDPLLLIVSNILAVLTVRSMYSALARVMHRFTYVKAALVFVLLFAAALMFLSHHYAIAPEVALSVIVGILCVGAGASLVADRGQGRAPEPPLGYEVAHYAGLTVRQARKLIILVIGLSIIALSVPVGILLPGPGGIPMALLGLMILATEFVWAQRLLRRARQGADMAAAEAEKRFGLVTKFRRLKGWVARRLGSQPPAAG